MMSTVTSSTVANINVHINGHNISFRTAVPFWGQSTQSLSSFPPKRDCGPKRVDEPRPDFVVVVVVVVFLLVIEVNKSALKNASPAEAMRFLVVYQYGTGIFWR